VVTALYRRYRPETFAEMIGQSQVTEPLMTALRTDRVNHAYLFSGPRGCGKTTSARILARCLNCAQGPTDTPCGTCPSCVELSRGGGGSLDVVEIDAASHNGVDDARDLRERAVFAPARDRYKIFILDEAHMVTPQGFNALLKLVEEPPDHVKFIFATTEPDKVLGTIRSRTHHYPFRLVPPAPMLEYVQQLCEEEGIGVQPGVLALVVRAGGGSPRDTLSLLDQLIAGSEGSTIDYERAVALLGYTHGALLDEVVDAIGAADAAGAFAAADRVVQTGQDPRRFVEDLLERLRDLIVVSASSPEAAAAVLRGVPEDELARMAAQAKSFGQAELSRVADLVNQTLTEMTGATSPRLHLELMLARVLVPAADETERGALARVERLERRVGVDGALPTASSAGGASRAEPAGADGGRGAGAGAGAAAVGAGGAAVGASGGAARAATGSAADGGAREAAAAGAAGGRTEAAGGQPGGAGVRGDEAGGENPAGRFGAERRGTEGRGGAGSRGTGDAASAGAATGGASSAGESSGSAGGDAAAASPMPVGPVSLQQIRDAWPEVLAALQRTKRSAWMVAFTAQVRDYRDDDVLVLGFPSEQDVAGFRGGGPGPSVSELLRNSIADVLGVRVKFIARAEGAANRAAGGDAGPRGDGPATGDAPTATPVGSSDPGGAASAGGPTSSLDGGGSGSGAAAPGAGIASSAGGSAAGRASVPSDGADGSASGAGAGAGVSSSSAGGAARGSSVSSGGQGPGRGSADAGANGAEARGAAGGRDQGAAASTPGAARQGAAVAHGSTVTATAVVEPVRATGPVDSWATITIPTDPSAIVGGETIIEPRATGGPEATSATAAAGAPTAAATATAVAERPANEPFEDIPSDADAPPEDFEPPFDPGPEPEIVLDPAPAADGPRGSGQGARASNLAGAPSGAAPAGAGVVAGDDGSNGAAPIPAAGTAAQPKASSVRPGPSRAAKNDGIQRYGESVVREVLGARFLEEVEAPGFGERG
jgi:DNA polymerase-3 subunit gamma/tau